MVDHEELIQVDKQRALSQGKRVNKEDSLTNGYHDGIIDLTHRQGLTGVSVKLPYGAFIQR
jgi:hypothetical protein